jgi:hypothetical protein
MAAALLANTLGALTQTILIVLALVGVATGGIPSMSLFRVKEGRLLEDWMKARAPAETKRLSYFSYIANASVEPLDPQLELLKLEYFRRYQLDLQLAYYKGRRSRHRNSVARPLWGRWKYQTATPTASSKTTELATLTNKPVRLRAAVRSLPGPAGADGRSSSGLGARGDATGGMAGVVPGGWTPAPTGDIDGSAVSPRASLKVSFSTRKSRRVSKLTGLISTACRRVNLANPLGSSCGDGILALSTRMRMTRTSSRIRAVSTSIRTKSCGSSMRLAPLASVTVSHCGPMRARSTSHEPTADWIRSTKSSPGSMLSTSLKTRSAPSSATSTS